MAGAQQARRAFLLRCRMNFLATQAAFADPFLTVHLILGLILAANAAPRAGTCPRTTTVR